MGVLDQIMQMRNQGIADQDIVSQLQEQGLSPKSINDALNQANIKSAVGGVSDFEEGVNSSQYNDDFNVVPSPSSSQQGEDTYAPPSPGDSSYYPPSQSYSQYPQQQPAQYQEFYPQQGAGQDAGGYYSPGGMDADTMVEIAQQVFNEKIKKVQQQIEEFNDFKTVYQTRIDNINERLKRMENVIDRLQISILDKVGEYGKGLDNVKKELSMVQDSFGKMVNTVADKKEHHSQRHQHHAGETSQHTHKAHKKTASKSGKRK